MPEATYNDNDIAFLKLIKSTYVIGSNVLSVILKDIYKAHPCSDNGNKIFREFGKELFGSKFEKTKCHKTTKKYLRFSSTTNEPIEFNECCLILGWCTTKFPKFKDFFDSFKEFKDLKNIRNEVSHKSYDNLDEIEHLKCKLTELLVLLCEKIGLFLNCEDKYSDEKIKVQSGISSIFKSEIAEELIKSSQDELIEKYKLLKLEKIPFLSNSLMTFQLRESFTNVTLDLEGRSVECANVLFEKHHDIDSSKPVVISGHFGSGKTTLCKYLIEQWCDHTEGYGIYDVVLFIDDLKRVTEKNIYDYIQNNLLPKTFSMIEPSKVQFFWKQLKILFIIDGYDEKSQNGELLINDILKNFGNMKILITTRIEFKEDLFRKLQVNDLLYLNIVLRGFHAAEQRKSFIGKMFDIAKKNDIKCGNEEDFSTFMKDNSRIFGDLLQLPLFTILFILLWSDSRNNSHNKIFNFTNLYDEILRSLSNRLIRKLIGNSDYGNTTPTELQNKVDILLLSFYEECYKYFKSNIYENLQIKMESLCSKQKIDYSIFLSSYLLQHEVRTRERKTIYYYDFFHKSHLEFLAAKYIVKMLLSTKKDMSSFLNMTVDSMGVTGFVIGLLNEEGADAQLKNVMNCLEKELLTEYDICWKLLSETRKRESDGLIYNETLIQHFNKSLRKQHWSLNADDIISGLNLMNLIKGSGITSLLMDIKQEIEPHSIPYFLDTLSDLKCTLFSEKTYIEVVIDFKNHHEASDQNDRRTDDSFQFLKQIHPWGQLSKFTGYFDRDFSRAALDLDQRSLECLKWLQLIKVRFTNLSTFCNFNTFLNGANCLKKPADKIEIILDFDFSVSVELFPKFSETVADVSLTFYFVEPSKITSLSKVMKKMFGHGLTGCSKLNLYKTNAIPEDFNIFKKEVTDIIRNKLTIEFFFDNDDIEREPEAEAARFGSGLPYTVVFIF